MHRTARLRLRLHAPMRTMALRQSTHQGQAATYAFKFAVAVHALEKLAQRLCTAILKTHTVI